MELNQTFSYSGWDIKYTLLNTSSQATSDTAKTPPIVFVHGTPWSSQVFLPLAQALSSQPSSPQILLYDLPGYGQSQTYTPDTQGTEECSTLFQGDTSIRFQAQALAALLHHLDLQSPNIIAHDIAGTIVLRAHLLHSVDFSSMLLMDTNTVLPWGDGFYKLVRSNPEVFTNLPAHVFEAVLRATIRSASHDPDENLMDSESSWEDVLAQPWLGKSREAEEFCETDRSSG
ncbi:Putative alpha/beta hydrolase-1 [Septoria linicola]|uniref:Alpha/beta hydrolase-1 n=1 Tax=Septoria linicola TaxID=215465 RepID=A0A9Q9AVV4_9PEZI|nr:Putative alpha/beta hydrolase-1 [Septoria linicola]